jgi:uncharacterized protein with NRDE domain
LDDGQNGNPDTIAGVCLIIVAHRMSDRFPLVVAANRDEEYARPTRPAHFWDDAPDVLGGRDLMHGGSWLAISRGGRVAAVTNLRGAPKPGALSRGFLVRDFVTSSIDPRSYAEAVARRKDEYSGFHLIAGTIGGEIVHLSDELRVWPPGIYGVSNGPADARWEKIDRGVEHVRDALQIDDATALAADLIDFLGTPTSNEIERTVFVAGDRYGTRSSTAIVATSDEILFVEQPYRVGERQTFRITR